VQSVLSNLNRTGRLPKTLENDENMSKEPLINTLRKGDADLRFYITTVQDG